MKHRLFSDLEKRGESDLLVLPFWEGGKEAASIGALKGKVAAALKTGDFKGKKGELMVVYWEGEKEPRALLLGLGKAGDATPESMRRAAASAVRWAQGKKVKSANFIVPKTAVEAFFEGILLANYAFAELKGTSLKENPMVLLDSVGLVGVEKSDESVLEKLTTIGEGVFFARDLVNGNADDITPKKLAETAQALAKRSSRLKATIFDKKKLEQEGMGLILAVNRGSSTDPYLIQLAYHGDPKSKEHIVLVGKGITYDTGGLSLKPTDNMMTMKCDMSGAAAVLGAVRVAEALGLKVNVTAVVPSTENSIDGKSYKLGDVYRAYNGKTVEINNTDAEGRLILADAMSYAAKHLKPTCMIDIATLTGSVVIGLGEEIAGLFSPNDRLAKDLLEASEKTAELLWRLPVHGDYRDSLKSDIADLLNTGPGRDAGAIKATLFLQEFVGDVPWAHIDAAGPCFLTKPKHYHTTKATGYGVRLFIQFLEQRSS
ncbi:MAG: leucyl aminopeptidase [Verrucomicrobiota bacterium]|nr:leucyl aminopeptidase [Verrucomicrobiota bacterium]